MRDFKKKYETPDFVMTPEDAREAQKQIERMLAERSKEQEAIKAARDEKLQSIGIDASDDYFLEKLAEVKQIADSVEKQAVKEVQEMLELIPEASAAAPESTSVVEASEAPAQVTQTSNLPLIITSPVSPSNDSDLDYVPIGQRIGRTLTHQSSASSANMCIPKRTFWTSLHCMTRKILSTSLSQV